MCIPLSSFHYYILWFQNTYFNIFIQSNSHLKFHNLYYWRKLTYKIFVACVSFINAIIKKKCNDILYEWRKGKNSYTVLLKLSRFLVEKIIAWNTFSFIPILAYLLFKSQGSDVFGHLIKMVLTIVFKIIL